MKRIVSYLLFFVCISIAVLFVTKYNIVVDCPILTITGFYCPGCGITRLFQSLLAGQIYQAFRYNPLLFIILITTPVYLVIYPKINQKNNKRILYGTVIIVLLYTVLRNIPLFSFLEPTTL